MRLLLTTLLLLINIALFAQNEKDPIIGKWKFELNHNIDLQRVIVLAKIDGIDITNKNDVNLVVLAVNVVAQTRCEQMELTISEYNNQVMLITKYNDNTYNDDIEWGNWKKTEDGDYKLIFENRVETYYFSDLTNEFFLKKNKKEINLMNRVFSDNLKLKKIE